MRNRDKRLEYQREYYRRNREKCIERVRISEYRRFRRLHTSGTAGKV